MKASRIEKLGEVCDFIGGSQPPKSTFVYDLSELDETEYVRLIQIRDYKSDKHVVYISKSRTKKFCTKDDIMIGRYGPPVFQILKGLEGAYNVALMKAVPKTKEIDSDYLFRFLASPEVQGYIIKLSERAAGQTGVNKQALHDYPILVPPISEQKRIVAIIDQALADIEQARAKTEQNLKNARELFESYLQQVFSQRGEGWVETTLENLVTDDCSLSYGIVQPGDDVNGGMAVVRPTDMKKELINLDGLKLIDPVKAEGYQRTKLKGGELLVCVRGSTGITSIACNSLAGSNVTRGIVPVRFDPLKISDRFGYYQFISPLVQTQIKSATYGAALMQINIRDFRKIILSVPTLEKQTEIANKLDEIAPELKKVEKIYDSKISALDELKKSILQKAFSGELTKTIDGDTSKGAAA
jgi:type I restriction enzyme S subunit